MMTEPPTSDRIIVTGGIDAIQAALRDVAEQRGISRAVINEIAELAEGHAEKLLAMIPTKRLGEKTLPKLITALGKRLVLEDDPEALAQIADFLGGRREKLAITHRVSIKQKTLSYVTRVAERLNRRARRELGKRANQARNAKLPPALRKSLARHAVNIRWKRHRAAKKAKAEELKCQILVTAASQPTGKASKPSKSN